MRLRVIPLWLALVLGCRGAAPVRDERPHAVELVSLSAAFPRSDSGELELALEVSNREGRTGSITSVSWEVWLGGRWFAAGQQAVSVLLPLNGRAKVELELPVAFRDLEVRHEPTSVEVGVRGGVMVSYSGAVQRLPFEATRRIIAQGAPVLTVPGEED